MAKTSKNKSYTEDVVLNKILKDIAEENLENSDASSKEHTNHESYEDDLIKRYREKDALAQRQTYFKIAKTMAFVLTLIGLVSVFINYIDSIIDEPTLAKKKVTPTPTPKVENVYQPANTETIIIKSEEITPLKREGKKVNASPTEEPVKKVKTERELAKENLLRQMNN